MSCDFRSLYCGDNGYVVRCMQCNHYQIAFLSTMLTLKEQEFKGFCQQVRYKAEECLGNANPRSKIIMIGTPSQSVHLILTTTELKQLHQILEEADCEMRTLELLELFK